MKVNFKRITLLFLTLFFIVSVNNTVAQNASKSIPDGPQRFFYSNGKVSSEGNFKNGIPDGVWKAYYENGNLKS